MELQATLSNGVAQRVHLHRPRFFGRAVGVHATAQFRQAQCFDQRERLSRIHNAQRLLLGDDLRHGIHVERTADVVQRIDRVFLIPHLPLHEALEFQQDILDLAIQLQDHAVVIRQLVDVAQSARIQVSVEILLSTKRLLYRQPALFLVDLRASEHVQKGLQINGFIHGLLHYVDEARQRKALLCTTFRQRDV